LLISACEDIPRDNVLDPKNPESFSKPVVLIEAFVNNTHPAAKEYSFWAIQGLVDLKETYADQIAIAEYHRDLKLVDSTYNDPYSDDSADQIFTNLHQKYVGENAEIPRSIPDVFINGYINRISGAADANSVYILASGIVENLLSNKNYYRIEPIIENKGSGNIKIDARVAKLGNKSAEGLKVRVVFIKDYAEQNVNRVVMETTLAAQVPTIGKGGYEEIELGNFSFEDLPTSIIIVLLSSDERTVLQCVKQDI